MHVAHVGLSTTPNHAEATVRPFNRLRSHVRRSGYPPNCVQNINDINGRCVTVRRDLSFDPSFLSSQGARMRPRPRPSHRAIHVSRAACRVLKRPGVGCPYPRRHRRRALA
jgi:hypothetical protein